MMQNKAKIKTKRKGWDKTWWEGLWGGGGSASCFGTSRDVSLRWRRALVSGLLIVACGANWWDSTSHSLAQRFLAESVELGKLRNSWTVFLLLLPFFCCWDGNSSLQVGAGVEGPPLFPTSTPRFNFSTINPSLFFSLLSIFLFLPLSSLNSNFQF